MGYFNRKIQKINIKCEKSRNSIDLQAKSMYNSNVGNYES